MGPGVFHGGISPGEIKDLGLDPRRVLDFSANLNPLGISKRVRRALSKLDPASYPDPECCELREALASSTGARPQNLLVGNGSTELIHLLARACLEPGSVAVILAPTFGEYEQACRLSGVAPLILPAGEEKGFQWDIARVCRQIRDLEPRLVFLCNPNNPTGVYLDSESVRKIASSTVPGILILDEAYLAFVENSWASNSLLEAGNVVLLRSLTKDHGLAGLRLGYLLGPEAEVEHLKLYQPSWSVNAAAQRTGLEALSDPGHILRAREVVAEGRAYLSNALSQLGLSVLPSSANFLLVRVEDAGAVRSALLQRGLCVRDCSSFGLPEYIRVAVRKLPECRRLIEGLEEIEVKRDPTPLLNR